VILRPGQPSYIFDRISEGPKAWIWPTADI